MMNIRTKRWICLLGSGLCVLPAYAQERQIVDTLRRSLTVITEDSFRLEERQPLPIDLVITPWVASAVQYKYADVSYKMPTTSPNHLLKDLPQLDASFPTAMQVGYVSAYLGGADLAGQLRAGLRAIRGSHHSLDIHAVYAQGRYKYDEGRHSEYPSGYGIDQHRKDFSLDGIYRYAVNNGDQLRVQGSYAYHTHNYWGLIPPNPFVNDRLQLTPSYIDLLGADKLRASQLRANFSYKHPLSGDNLWNYELGGGLQWSGLSFEGFSGNQTQTTSYLLPEFAGSIERSISGDHRIGLRGNIAYVFYNHANGSLMAARGLDKKTAELILNLSPYYTVAGGDAEYRWDIKAGLGLSSTSGVVNSGLFLYPNIDAMLTFGRVWNLHFVADGGSQSRYLYSAIEAMPLLGSRYALDPERVRYRTKLELSGLVGANLRLSFSGEYQRVDNALSYMPELHSDAVVALPKIVYAPYYTDLKQFRLSAQAGYLLNQRIELEAGFDYYKYNSSRVVSSRADLELHTSIRYRMFAPLELSATYRHAQGIYQYDLQGGTYEASGIDRLNLSASYRLNSQWSFSAMADIYISPNTSCYLGMPMQRFCYQVGANYNF